MKPNRNRENCGKEVDERRSTFSRISFVCQNESKESSLPHRLPYLSCANFKSDITNSTGTRMRDEPRGSITKILKIFIEHVT